SEILNQYTALTGRAGQPGLWPMGVWLDQAPGQSVGEVLRQVRALRAQDLALDVLNLSPPAALSFQADKSAFEWDARLGDWREFAAACAELNVQPTGACFPGVPQDTVLFDEWEDRGWLL